MNAGTKSTVEPRLSRTGRESRQFDPSHPNGIWRGATRSFRLSTDDPMTIYGRDVARALGSFESSLAGNVLNWHGESWNAASVGAALLPDQFCPLDYGLERLKKLEPKWPAFNLQQLAQSVDRRYVQMGQGVRDFSLVPRRKSLVKDPPPVPLGRSKPPQANDTRALGRHLECRGRTRGFRLPQGGGVGEDRPGRNCVVLESAGQIHRGSTRSTFHRLPQIM
jgi:hypothetical protein